MYVDFSLKYCGLLFYIILNFYHDYPKLNAGFAVVVFMVVVFMVVVFAVAWEVELETVFGKLNRSVPSVFADVMIGVAVKGAAVVVAVVETVVVGADDANEVMLQFGCLVQQKSKSKNK